MKHNHGCTSNTSECFRTFIGCKVVGLLDDKTLVFECGWGLTLNHNGAHWVETPEEIARATERVRDKLRAIQKGLKDVLKLAGVTP